MKLTVVFLMIICGMAGCQVDKPSKPHSWALLPFEKVDSLNPILTSHSGTTFFCPVTQGQVPWEAQDVYNPAAVVKDGRIYMLYRAEDTLKVVNGTSRLGLAVSEDGLHFTRLAEPVFYPSPDSMLIYEWPGGCEDPRVVEDSSGRYILTYTAYDGQTARLCVATSLDLRIWIKHGLAFKQPELENMWSKSGSIVCRVMPDGRMVAEKINGKYWMYWGEHGFLASSDNLLDWTYIADTVGQPSSVIPVRDDPDIFDNALVEPGPPAIITPEGIVLIYNGARRNPQTNGIDTYCGGQALMDNQDPSRLIDRMDAPFIRPEKPYELTGLVNKVTFSEGLAFFKGRWFLYYGTADSRIAVAQGPSHHPLEKVIY